MSCCVLFYFAKELNMHEKMVRASLPFPSKCRWQIRKEKIEEILKKKVFMDSLVFSGITIAYK